MPVHSACEFALLDYPETIERVRAAVSAGEPFSLIRLGDGEAIVLSLGEDMWLQDLAYLHGHWGSEGVTLGAIAEVKRDLEAAIEGADLVGIRDDIVNVSLPADLLDKPGRELREIVISAFPLRKDEIENLSTIGARRLALLHRVLSRMEWRADQQFCSAWVHWELLATGTLNSILEGASHVGLVTSRPQLEYLVSRRFDVKTSAVVVPDKFAEGKESGRHVPDRYRSIRSQLRFPEGTLVLVGAGIPGKVYCDWLKEAGCVAIDVGSVFDAWVGKASRPRVLESRFGIAAGHRVPAELQLGLPAPAEDRRLVPRWKPSGVRN
ncbi:MAG TPA: hypothetical protein VHL52_08665 [Acidimicrobiia bacterium]|nr:hypothetical protein [Acidimicrobiia bacterium]